MPTLKEPLAMIEYIEKLTENNNIIVAFIGGLFLLVAAWIGLRGKNEKVINYMCSCIGDRSDARSSSRSPVSQRCSGRW